MIGQSTKNQQRWERFITQENLSSAQADAFQRYTELLLAWNEQIDLTAITELSSIISYHFQDSLALAKVLSVESVTALADVGTGAGFPGIPLAIKYPHLEVTLIEVSFKKIKFLDAVISALQLGDRVSVYDQDWRTFLRTTDFAIDLFCARASLQPEELMRMFKPASSYRDAELVYWASKEWEPSEKIKPFIEKIVRYKVGNRQRQLVLMKKK